MMQSYIEDTNYCHGKDLVVFEFDVCLNVHH